MDARVQIQGRRGTGGPFAWIGRRVLARIDRGIAAGAITASLPGDVPRRVGGRVAGPEAIVILHSWRSLWRLATGGSAGWYEAWAAGEWESPDPVALFELFTLNRHTLARAARAQGLGRWLRRQWHRARHNDRAGAKRNIVEHYDLGNEFYELWLDPSMTYSSALFAAPDQSLEDAQNAKLQAIFDRTGCGPGDRILEIGCGWGSFAETAARAGAKVHGITLSGEQKAYAAERLARQDLAGEITLTDYRDVTGTYDGVASIEMVEAVGAEYWRDYLTTIARALKPGGRAAIQYISIDDAIYEDYASNVDFIQRYVFPGGMLLSESRFRAIAERVGLTWQDRHGFGRDYAETLQRWRAAFDAVVAAGSLPPRFDRRFIGLWRYYLMYCEGGFRGGAIDVAQVTLVKAG
ncbi:class I SAM-dependent methyltransferase [Sphingomonas panacisoli]|uniref:Class I SAM-dependent methyltransferase n=1 Tax=Sphingomonas panacisoli TaxID=1813879 RepID=A0A5B8LH52_9SPHN|nr:cyclopropane-fatty-acyl-phospholipid synthase family protein [Sphingomonas panacisoli]QDZ07403.1 class I SAM-dependent methyltransferase [Sphingomonas panacisoli]